MSQAELASNLLLLYGKELSPVKSNKYGAGKVYPFFDDLVDGGFESDIEEDDYLSDTSDIVDIFSDDELYGGYDLIEKNIDSNKDTYEESELSNKNMYSGGMYSEDEDDFDIYEDYVYGGGSYSKNKKTLLESLPVIPQ